MIDCGHVQGGFACNGNLSNVEGGFEVHWTLGGRGEPTAEARSLTSEGFALLWDGIAASIREDGVFGKCLVTDPTRLIDPDLHHVITTTQVQDGRMQHRTFMVPSSEADTVFVAWLNGLAIPGSARRGASMPERTGQGTGMAGDMKVAVQRDKVPA